MKTTFRVISLLLILLMTFNFSGCTSNQEDTLNTPEDVPPDSGLSLISTNATNVPARYKAGDHITPSDLIRDIVEHPAFQGYGEKLLPSVGDENDFDISLGEAARGSDRNQENIAASLNHLIDEAIVFGGRYI